MLPANHPHEGDCGGEPAVEQGEGRSESTSTSPPPPSSFQLSFFCIRGDGTSRSANASSSMSMAVEAELTVASAEIDVRLANSCTNESTRAAVMIKEGMGAKKGAADVNLGLKLIDC